MNQNEKKMKAKIDKILADFEPDTTEEIIKAVIEAIKNKDHIGEKQ